MESNMLPESNIQQELKMWMESNLLPEE